MTPAELRKIGKSLFGARWQSKLAKALPVSPRAVRYWLSGERCIRPPMAKLICSLTAENVKEPPVSMSPRGEKAGQ